MIKQQNKIMVQRKNTRNAQRHRCLHTEDPIKKKKPGNYNIHAKDL